MLAAAPPLQRYFTSPGQLTANGLLGGAMRELLQAQTGSTAAAAGAVQRRVGWPIHNSHVLVVPFNCLNEP